MVSTEVKIWAKDSMKSEGEAYLLLGMLIDGFCGGHVPNVSSYMLWICLLAF